MAGIFKFDAILVDPELDTRMRLKQATTSVHEFGRVLQYSNLRETKNKLEGSEKCDVVFISHRIDKAEISEFIKVAKTTQQGQDAAYILVLKGGGQDSGTVAQNVMIGADGFLMEPYSVDQLVEITKLSARVRKERSQAREEAAIRFLLSDIMNHIDLIAFAKASGLDVGRSLPKFRELCTVLQTLSPESKDIYYKLALNLFENAPLPRKVFAGSRKYGGASSRVKKKMEEKMLEDLEKEFTAKTES